MRKVKDPGPEPDPYLCLMDPDPWKKNHADHADPVSDNTAFLSPDPKHSLELQRVPVKEKSYLIYSLYFFFY